MSAAPREPKSLGRSAGVGLVAAIFGILPWVLGGGILPGQNLWAVPSDPTAIRFVLLPVSQYDVMQLVCLLVIGGVFAGLVVRLMRTASAGMVATVLFLAQLAIGAQSFLVVAGGLALGTANADSRADAYFWGLAGLASLGAILSQVGFWMISTARTPIAALGLALAAVPFGTWTVFGISNLYESWEVPDIVRFLDQWLPATVVGVALIWCGLRPLSRLTVWVLSLAALFVLPSVMSAMMHVLASRNILGMPDEMLSVGIDSFLSALPSSWSSVFVALAIGLLGAAVRMLVVRRPAA